MKNRDSQVEPIVHPMPAGEFVRAEIRWGELVWTLPELDVDNSELPCDGTETCLC